MRMLEPIKTVTDPTAKSLIFMISLPDSGSRFLFRQFLPLPEETTEHTIDAVSRHYLPKERVCLTLTQKSPGILNGLQTLP